MATALVLIDVQRNMLEGDEPVPGAPEIRSALEDLLAFARRSLAVVVHVQNDGPAGSPDEPMTYGWELVLPAADGEVVVRKDDCDVFASNPELAQSLRDRGVDRVVVAGMQSEFCIEESSLGALAQGFQVVLPRGSHATYDDGPTTAAQVSAQVERKLVGSGVKVVGLSEVDF